MRINNKGFTLVEVLSVIVIIAILGFIAVPNVLSTINVGKNKSYDIMISNIVTASESLYQEVEYGGGKLYKYNNNGITDNTISINNNNNIEVNLQTLVSNGFLEGTNNNCTTCGGNQNEKILLDPRTKQDIGDCNIKIIKNIDSKVSYVVNKNDLNVKCPSIYEKGVK